MAVKLKSKVALGGLFLFLLLLLVGGVSLYHFRKMIDETKDVLKANYETVEFANNMLSALTEWKITGDSTHSLFEENLQRQEANITENNEAELTGVLRKDFERFTRHPDSLPLLHAVQRDIVSLVDLNLNAINEKSTQAQMEAERAKLFINIIITFCVLAGFTFVFNFPGIVAGPISKLTEAIKAIAHKDYSQRIHLERKDEFGEMADAFNNMAEQLDRYEHSNLAKIMFEKQRAETVINSLKDASIGIDTKGIILFANEKALQLLNVKEQEIVGRSQEEIMNRNDLFRFLIESDIKTPFKVVLDERENFFTREIIEITSAEENLGKVIIIENITSFKELDVAKTNFIATISHELKTPLASSDFSLKLLEDARVGQLTGEQRELIRHLKDDNQRMLRILSELLNMSQVEAGKIQLVLQDVYPGAPVEDSVLAVTSAAQEKGITLQRLVERNLPVLRIDPDKVSWVLNNFLTNAIKFSPVNSTVSVSAKKASGHISFAVMDEGPGIDESYQKRIFDRYFQVPGRSEKKGSGIGLAICKEFIEAMGGKVWVKSQLGRGSTFGFDLPITS